MTYFFAFDCLTMIPPKYYLVVLSKTTLESVVKILLISLPHQLSFYYRFYLEIVVELNFT